MLKLTDYLCLGTAVHEDEFIGLRLLEEKIYLGKGDAPSYIDILLSGVSPLVLTNAIELNYLKLFGGTEQRNLPSEYTQVNYVTNTVKTLLNTGLQFDFSKNYEIEIRARGTLGSWYMFQAREAAGAPTHGISGSSSGDTIILGFNGSSISTSQVSRITGNIYYIKGTINNGNLTLYVKNETAGTEETVTGTYTPSTGTSVNIGLFGNSQTQGVAPNTDVYYARIKENGNYILNYVPCRQSATAGFYDKVSGTLKTTTDLSAGSNAVPTPDTPIDIVCNNGVVKVSKNLFDYRYFYDNYQTYSPSAVGRCPIKLQPNTQYTVSTNKEVYSTSASMFVVSGSAIDWTPITANNGILVNRPRTVTTDSNGYLCFGLYVTTENAIPESYFINGTVWVQIEQGSIATSYMPYSQIYTDVAIEQVTDSLGNTANAEMLLSVGDYKDTQEVLTGSVTRNVGIKVLDGTENWAYHNTTQDVMTIKNVLFPDDFYSNPDNNVGYCNYYKVVARSSNLASVLTSGQMGWNTSGNIMFKWIESGASGVTSWKQYLADQYNAGTPVIVVYPTSSPVTEQVAPQHLTVQQGTNIVTITQASIDNLTMELSYKQEV